MRFRRTERSGPFEDTRRKRLALARKQRLEREAVPLLADLIAEKQPAADDVMAERAAIWERQERARRAFKAAQWRKARRRLAGYGDNIRPVLRRLWNEAPYPGDPTYLLCFLHDYETGRLDPDNPPWVYRGAGLKAVDLDAIIARARERAAA